MMRERYVVLLSFAAMLSGCREREMLAVKYELAPTIDPASLIRVTTLAAPSARDGRHFIADSPQTQIGIGVFAEIRAIDEGGALTMVITHDATRGFQFERSFELTLIPTPGSRPPELTLTARGAAIDGLVGETAAPVVASFGRGNRTTLALVDVQCGGVRCAGGDACCDGTCVRVNAASTTNCGACGRSCGPAETCENGSCRCASGPGCSGAETCCSDGCVDTRTNPFHCGGCGRRCNDGEMCVNGTCECPSNAGRSGCASGQLCCPTGGCSSTGSCACGSSVACTLPNLCCAPDMCLDVQTDPKNCGRCGNECPKDAICLSGRCRCGNDICTTGTCCIGATGSRCVDTSSDANNCGGCGIRCGQGAQCVAGVCRCPSSAPSVGEVCNAPRGCCLSRCVDLSSDRFNCGFCGNACPTNEDCASGSCRCGSGPSCSPPNAICCSGFAGYSCIIATQCPTDGCNCGPKQQCCMCWGMAICIGDQEPCPLCPIN